MSRCDRFAETLAMVTDSQRPVRGATAAPLRSVELTGIDPLTNAQRLENFKQRLECGWIVGKARKVMERAA